MSHEAGLPRRTRHGLDLIEAVVVAVASVVVGKLLAPRFENAWVGTIVGAVAGGLLALPALLVKRWFVARLQRSRRA